ncbi:protein GDAP2 homolog [Uranotaenia lowii]|uniref:protein GDAP2 homolog n=1 Tax=Uranotaenia lowii TaxID=190385 RepID=UPI00247847F2|nr:protein GDAP2 homolog [Uranotaenia lowii]
MPLLLTLKYHNLLNERSFAYRGINYQAMRLVSDIYNESIEPSLGGITKPLTQQYITVDSLIPWGSKDLHLTPRPRPADYSHQFPYEGPRHESVPFPADEQINQRFVIWEGDISLLAVDAITNTTDETLTEKNRISKRIFGRAGAALTSAVVHDFGRCKTGEVCVTPGFFLPAKYIIHTVGPIYSEKYRTASESTLHSCYRNVLYKAKELGLRTIALCDISSVQRNFPPDTAAHIALRTIRRFLEQYRSEIVIVCLDPNERGIYEVLAPLYFPRDLLEERSALWQLPKDIGGSYGEPQLADRQIRIIRNPQHAVMIEALNPRVSVIIIREECLSQVMKLGDGWHPSAIFMTSVCRVRSADTPRFHGLTRPAANSTFSQEDRRDVAVFSPENHQGVVALPTSPLTRRTDASPLLVDCETTETYCPDAIGHVLATHIGGKRTRILDGSFTYVELMKHYSSSLDLDPDWQKENLYERLLRRAKSEDLSEVSGIGCLYQSGVDRLGRPVVVFCGKWFPAQNIDLDKALLYLIYLLDPIVKGDYVIAYFHTLTSSNNYPSLQWLKDVYSILPYKYKKNLKAFYIVHPTFWTKMMTWWFTTFMAPAIKTKVHSLPGVEHLYSAIAKDQLEIPAYITEYDMATNGIHYFQPVTNTSSPAS